jgi:hypothetical protein
MFIEFFLYIKIYIKKKFLEIIIFNIQYFSDLGNRKVENLVHNVSKFKISLFSLFLCLEHKVLLIKYNLFVFIFHVF